MAACVVADSHTHQSANDVLTMCASLGLVGFEWILVEPLLWRRLFGAFSFFEETTLEGGVGQKEGGRGVEEHGTLVISNETVPVQSDGTVWRILVPWQLPEYDQWPRSSTHSSSPFRLLPEGSVFCAPIVQHQISKGI